MPAHHARAKSSAAHGASGSVYVGSLELTSENRTVPTSTIQPSTPIPRTQPAAKSRRSFHAATGHQGSHATRLNPR